jgi:phage tail sheath gpL-like
MLLILTKSGGCVPLEILSIEDGTVLKSFNHLLHRNKKVDFIEQFNEKLLVKQENENLQILDARITVVIFKYFFIHTQKCTKIIRMDHN